MKKIIIFFIIISITITSSMISREIIIYGSIRTTSFPPSPWNCMDVYGVRKGVGEKTNFWVLYNNSLGRKITTDDFLPVTIEDYIENNIDNLSCVDMSYTIE